MKDFCKKCDTHRLECVFEAILLLLIVPITILALFTL